MKLLLKSFFLLVSICFSTNLHAQVTVGSFEVPAPGALLQLKENANVTDGNANSNKGLLLPRVRLTTLNDISDISGATGQKTEHTGLMVYNTNACLDASGGADGLYIWNGTKWELLGDLRLSNGVYTITDSRDGDVYLARNFGSEAGDWMLENMRYDPNLYPDPNFVDYNHLAAESTTDKNYCYAETQETPYIVANHPSSHWETRKKNGLLYTWMAATNGENITGLNQGEGSGNTTPQFQGICPYGWHVPSDQEWNDLEKAIYNNPEEYSSFPSSDVFNPTSWNTAWDTHSGSFYRGSSTNVGHSHAMIASCAPAMGSHFTTGKSLPITEGGFGFMLSGYFSSGVYGEGIYQSSSLNIIWTGSKAGGSKIWSRGISASWSGIARANSYNDGGIYGVRCKKD